MELDEYRKLAEVEDRMWYFHALNRRCGYWLARLLPAGPAKVLDAGCGTGGLIKALKAGHPAWECVGLDFMPLACELARERTGATIVEGSVLALPFPDASFDAVVSADVICQVKDAAQAMREIVRVMRPGGVVLVNAPALMWLWSYHDEACQTQHRYTRAELVALFAGAGIKVHFASYANFLLLPGFIAWRKWVPQKNPTSDMRAYPAPLEWAARILTGIEFMWQRLGLASPLGSSVMAVGRKP
jgi:SAM-dependent methyltransferase